MSSDYLASAVRHFPVVARALVYVERAHGSIAQKRKFTGEPYVHHLREVAGILASVVSQPVVISAGLLSDVVEDVPGYSADVIEAEFGGEIASLTIEVTNPFTKAAHPSANRKQRVAMEVARLEGVSDRAKLIKLADIISNTRNVAVVAPQFARTYLAEKSAALNVLRVAGSRPHERLHRLASAQIHGGLSLLERSA